MKNTILHALCLLYLASHCYAQKFEVGVELAGTRDKYKINDPNHFLINVPCDAGMGGINFRMNDGYHFYYELGILLKEYWFGFNFVQLDGYSITNTDQVILIPLRSGYRINISNKIAIVPVVGFVPGFKTLANDVSGGATDYNGSDKYQYNYTTRQEANENLLILLQGGLGLEFKIFNQLHLSLSSDFYHGLKQINIYDVTYSINNGRPFNAVIYNKGSFIDVGVGLRYIFTKRSDSKDALHRMQ